MQPSAKCDYALLALYALAGHRDPAPMKAAEIAGQHRIPIKFLEAILNQLKGGGFVSSRRGAEGGYRLARPPGAIVLGDVIRLIDGPAAVGGDLTGRDSDPDSARSPFADFWDQVGRAVADAVDGTTLADILEAAPGREPAYVADWTI